RGFLRGSSPTAGLYQGSSTTFEHIRPKVIPWHQRRAAVCFNHWQLHRQLAPAIDRLSLREPNLLVSYPAGLLYLDAIPHGKLVYLRLDDSSIYPGVDAELVHLTEQKIFERADAIVATARALVPGDPYTRKSHYLPQGVHYDHFAATPLAIPSGKV